MDILSFLLVSEAKTTRNERWLFRYPNTRKLHKNIRHFRLTFKSLHSPGTEILSSRPSRNSRQHTAIRNTTARSISNKTLSIQTESRMAPRLSCIPSLHSIPPACRIPHLNRCWRIADRELTFPGNGQNGSPIRSRRHTQSVALEF